MLERYLPWRIRGVKPLFSAYGDPFLFRGVAKTRSVATNLVADVGLHSIVPHQNLFVYLVAAKTFLRHEPDVSKYVHDDGSLTPTNKALLREHLAGVFVADRAITDRSFEQRVAERIGALPR